MIDNRAFRTPRRDGAAAAAATATEGSNVSDLNKNSAVCFAGKGRSSWERLNPNIRCCVRSLFDLNLKP